MENHSYILRPDREPGLELLGVIHLASIPPIKVKWYATASHLSYLYHSAVLRKSGESFHRHDARCAKMAALAGLPIEMPTIMLMHEFEEDDHWSPRKLERCVGRDVAISVHGLSKRPKSLFPDPDGRQKRILDNVDRMKRCTEAGPILAGLYDCNWFVPMGRALDRGDNSVDTAALLAPDRERLFMDNDRVILPYLRWALDYIPRRYRPQYQMLLGGIENACDNYWRSMAMHRA